MESKTSSFNYESKDYLKKLNKKDYYWYYDILQEVLKHSPNNTLELGCGDGFFSYLMHENGVRNITAVDDSITFLKYAKNRSNNKINFKRVDLNQLDQVEKLLNQKQYSLIVSLDCIEHLKNRELFLNKIFQHLRSGELGDRLILQCPNLLCNVLGSNYKHTPLNIMIKLLRGIKYYFIYCFLKITNQFRKFFQNIPMLEVGINYHLKKGLDYDFADEDTLVLLNSFWLLLLFKKNHLRVKKFTTFSFPSNNFFLKKIIAILSYIPFIAHLGGKMIFVVEKSNIKSN